MKKIIIILGILIFSTATVAKQSYEVGLGSSYGGIGVVFNSELSSNVEMYTGIGLDLENVGYVVGSKFWFNDKTALLTDYGTNCVVHTGGNWYASEGFNVGIRFAFNGQADFDDKNGFQIDLKLADISECNDNQSSVTDDSLIDIAVGYRF